MTADLDCWGQLGPLVEWGDRSRIRYGRNVMSWALPPSKYNAQEDTDGLVAVEIFETMTN